MNLNGEPTAEHHQRRKMDHVSTSPLIQIGAAICSLASVLLLGIGGPLYVGSQDRAEQRMKHIEDLLNQGQISGAAFLVRVDRIEHTTSDDSAKINQLTQDVTALKVKVDLLSVRDKQ